MRPQLCKYFAVAALLTGVVGRAAESRGEPRRIAVNPIPGRVGFALLSPAESGLAFTNQLSDARAAENQIRLNGSGVAAGDVDGDGLVDLYFCALENSNRLFRNQGGWKFMDVTASAGVECDGLWATGCAFADVDGDGDLDLLVNAIAVGTKLFLNDGAGKFNEAVNSGLARRLSPTSLALADVDGDSDLDLYVANYRTTTIRTTGFVVLQTQSGERMLRPQDRDLLEMLPDGRVLEHGEPDVFYLNEGGGRFRPIAWQAGRFLDARGNRFEKPLFDWGLSAMFRDLNRDGHPDLYVCNDFHSPDRIWLNDKGGTFKPLPELALRNTSTFSMSVDFADINRDGHDDFFVADMLDPDPHRRLMQHAAADVVATKPGEGTERMQFNRNTLQLNRGDGTYAEVAHYAGLEASGWTWSSAFLDVDLDGFEDLLITAGHMFDIQDMDAAARIDAAGPYSQDRIPGKLLGYPKMQSPKMAFRNRGDLKFDSVGREWNFDQPGVSHGMAFADLDNDGDLDIAVNNLNQAAGLYRNNSPAPRVAIRLKGRGQNTRGIGARIEVAAKGAAQQAQEMIAGGRYLSSDDPQRTFALALNKAAELRVHWRSGQQSVLTNVLANSIYEIPEPVGGTVATSQPVASTKPLFEDVSARLSHKHNENAFDDGARQPLLPNRLSQMGPGVSWSDVNGDGRDDLAIGSGLGGSLTIHLNGNDKFVPLDAPFLKMPVDRDQGWTFHLPARETIFVGHSNYEDGRPGGIRVHSFNLKSSARLEIGEQQNSVIGPFAAADFDGDGDVDLFVGGRMSPGRYPEVVDSHLYRNNGAGFMLDATHEKTFAKLGLVTAACATDLNGDGWTDLAVACEWGPIRIFKNVKGSLREDTSAWGPADRKGWWTSVAAADLNNDGQLDLIAGNWGLNTKYRATVQRPRRLYYGDFENRRTVDTIEAFLSPVTGKWHPERERGAASEVLPFIKERFATFRAYANASIEEILGERLSRAQIAEANTLESVVLLNKGNQFEALPLPQEAQFSPIFGLAPADFDGDGNIDLMAAQNFFAVQAHTSRNDAGVGLILLGKGDGTFRALAPVDSGVRIFGEQRGAAVSDFDNDGRVDFAVAQNGAATKLYRNIGGEPGVRVRFNAGPENPTGIGSVARATGGSTPSMEVQAGSGYWSQSSATLVFPHSIRGREIEVSWPGGKRSKHTVPQGATQVEISVPRGARLIE